MNYDKEVEHIELDEVMRQEENSGILQRHGTSGVIKRFFIDEFKFGRSKDIVRLTDGYDTRCHQFCLQ
jgi:hypothetical protein